MKIMKRRKHRNAAERVRRRRDWRGIAKKIAKMAAFHAAAKAAEWLLEHVLLK